eukprot:CCRYP_016615-RA/>CCRYP_016615-RA protein AED:0.48 eAED:0.94 QI:0/0/0/1/0/0/2/0/80
MKQNKYSDFKYYVILHSNQAILAFLHTKQTLDIIWLQKMSSLRRPCLLLVLLQNIPWVYGRVVFHGYGESECESLTILNR